MAQAIVTRNGYIIVASQIDEKGKGRVGWFTPKGKFVRLTDEHEFSMMKTYAEIVPVESNGKIYCVTGIDCMFLPMVTWQFVSSIKTPWGQLTEFVYWRKGKKDAVFERRIRFLNEKKYRALNSIASESRGVRSDLRILAFATNDVIKDLGGITRSSDVEKMMTEYHHAPRDFYIVLANTYVRGNPESVHAGTCEYDESGVFMRWSPPNSVHESWEHFKDPFPQLKGIFERYWPGTYPALG